MNENRAPWADAYAAQLASWISTLPLKVRKLAKEFPMGTAVPQALIKSARPANYYVFGWTEDDRLVITRFDPRTHHDLCISKKKYICAKHWRELH